MLKNLKKISLLIFAAISIHLLSSGLVYAETLSPTIYNPSTSVPVLSITPGPDGNMWFTLADQPKVAKSTLDGTITEYSIPSGGKASFITAGPDGNMWFTMSVDKKVAKITTSGVVTEYDLSSSLTDVGLVPLGIAAGPDGNMWVATGNLTSSSGNSKILKITTSGVVTEYDLPNGQPGATGIAAGPDGNMWFTRGGDIGSTNYIGKITMGGTMTHYTLPGLGAGSSLITTGPDGNMWYLRSPIDPETNKVGKITTSGVVTEYDLTDGAFAYYGIVSGEDGRIWFTESGFNKLAAIDTNGNITEYDLPVDFNPVSLAVGPDGNIWIGTQTAIAKLADSPGGGQPPTSNPPGTNNPAIPGSPRTGALLGAIVASSTLIGIVLLIGYEIKKTHHVSDASSK